MTKLFHKSIYNSTKTVPSYWEASLTREIYLSKQDRQQPGDHIYDIVIIGGGYTGLNAALEITQQKETDVAVLEAGEIAWGASGRNGGFCCLPATKLSITQMQKKYGAQATQDFWKNQIQAIEYVENLIQDEEFDVDQQGQGNIEVAHNKKAFEELKQYAEDLKQFDIQTQIYTQSEFEEKGYKSNEQFGALHMNTGFALNPLKFALEIARKAEAQGATLISNCRVEKLEKKGHIHQIWTTKGLVRAKKILIAANGFYEDGLQVNHDRRILPVLSNIITTRPLSEEEVHAHNWTVEEPICNTRKNLFYFRLLKDKRFLLGARGDWTGRPDDAARMQEWMTQRLYEIFPNWRHVEISYFWRGLVCMSLKRAPSVGFDRDDPSIFYAYGYHANGVNTASYTGRQIAKVMLGYEKIENAFPLIMRGHSQRFPVAPLRVGFMRAVSKFYDIMDR